MQDRQLVGCVNNAPFITLFIAQGIYPESWGRDRVPDIPMNVGYE
ncbi:hypothetical protein [Lusitaniella coriacea]